MTGMEVLENENDESSTRSLAGPDGRARGGKEAANQAVANMSRRVSGGGKTGVWWRGTRVQADSLSSGCRGGRVQLRRVSI